MKIWIRYNNDDVTEGLQRIAFKTKREAMHGMKEDAKTLWEGVKRVRSRYQSRDDANYGDDWAFDDDADKFTQEVVCIETRVTGQAIVEAIGGYLPGHVVGRWNATASKGKVTLTPIVGDHGG